MDALRFGLIGCGGNMRWHLSQLSRIPEVEICGLADPDPTQIQKTKLEHPHLLDVPVFSDYRELLDTVALDAVEISTPHTQHREQVEASFDKGLHVLIEKPLATTVEDCEAMIRARDRAGKIGYMSYQRHVGAEYQWARKALRGGLLGNVQMVSAMLSQEWKRFTTGSWRQDPSLSGGGMFLDSGSHMLDALLWMTGLEPQRVTAHLDMRGTPVEINAAVSFSAKNGVLGTITICGDAPNWHEEIAIWCDEGSVFIRNGKLTLRHADGSRFEGEEIRGGSNPDVSFVNVLLGREENPTEFEDGLRVMKLSQAAYESAACNGQPVELS